MQENNPNEVFGQFTSDTRFYACVGTKGSGKTYYTKQQAITFATANPDLTVTILDPHGTYGNAKMKNINVVTVESTVIKKNRNAYTEDDMIPPGMLIIDDLKEIWGNDTGDDLRSICRRMRHLGVDVFFCAHCFNDIPPRIFTFIDDFYIFRISENYNMIKHKLPQRITPKIIEFANNLKWRFDKNGARIGSEKIHVANYE